MAGRIVVIEPELVDDRGHHAHASLRFVELLGPHRCVVAAGRRWRGGDLLGGARIVPFFSRNRKTISRQRRYGRISAVLPLLDPFVKSLRASAAGRRTEANWPTASADARTMSSLLSAELSKCLDELAVDGTDRVFVPSADAEAVLAVSEVLSSRGEVPCFHLRLMYDDVGSHETDPQWRTAFRKLIESPRASERVRILTETTAFADEVRKLWPQPIGLLPHPSFLAFEPPPARESAFVVYAAGQARADKSERLIAATARLLAERSTTFGPVRLIVQNEARGPAGLEGIDLRPAQLSTDQYASCWRNSHVALLLHDPRVFSLRGSGAVCDAVAAGRPFIHLAGASLGEWAADGNGIGVAPTPQSIVQAILEIHDNYETLIENGERAKQRYEKTIIGGIATIGGGS